MMDKDLGGNSFHLQGQPARSSLDVIDKNRAFGDAILGATSIQSMIIAATLRAAPAQNAPLEYALTGHSHPTAVPQAHLSSSPPLHALHRCCWTYEAPATEMGEMILYGRGKEW